MKTIKAKNTTRYMLDTTIHKTTKAKKHKIICAGHHYMPANTNNVYMSHLQTTGGKDCNIMYQSL